MNTEIVTSHVFFDTSAIIKEITKTKKDMRFGKTVYHAGRLEVLESMLHGVLTAKEKKAKEKRLEKLGKRMGIL